MLYPENIEEKLGFDKIKERLLSLCLSTLGQRYVNNIRFVNQFDKLRPLLLQTAEFKTILTTGEVFPSANYFDVTPSLKKAKTEGAFLLEQELIDIKRSLETLISCVNFLNNKSEQYPALHATSQGLSLNESLPGQIGAVIDDKGVVRDNASQELSTVRRDMRKEHQQLRKTLESIFRSSKNNGYVPEGSSLTVRDGRMVIPLNVEYKRSQGIYLIFYKVDHEQESMRWEEAVKVALCYGWIDSTVKSLGKGKRKQYLDKHSSKSIYFQFGIYGRYDF